VRRADLHPSRNTLTGRGGGDDDGTEAERGEQPGGWIQEVQVCLNPQTELGRECRLVKRTETSLRASFTSIHGKMAGDGPAWRTMVPWPGTSRVSPT
jgi:hypothetical protein